MADIKIATEVSGRVCALLLQVGAKVAKGDDIALVEAMKMEIPIASPASGTIKTVLVNVDEMISEGQVIAIVET